MGKSRQGQRLTPEQEELFRKLALEVVQNNGGWCSVPYVYKFMPEDIRGVSLDPTGRILLHLCGEGKLEKSHDRWLFRKVEA